MLGVAGVALGSYAAMASNSATMTVTATIAHDVSLTAYDWDLGTITIDPAQTEGNIIMDTETGMIISKTGGIISISGDRLGSFTANVPDSCKVDELNSHHPCFTVSPGGIYIGGLSLMEGYIRHTEENLFDFQYDFISYYDTVPTPGDYSQNITITYTAP